MKTISIGNMVRGIVMLRDTNQLTVIDASFALTFFEKSNGGKNTDLLSDKDVEIVDRIYREHYE